MNLNTMNSLRLVRRLALAKKPLEMPQIAPISAYPNFETTSHIECEYRSNLWVASMPISDSISDEALDITLEDGIIKIKIGNNWSLRDDRQIKLPRDSKPESVTANLNRGTLFITAQLEDNSLTGQTIKVNRV
jgi:hypothetical protein